MKPINSHKHKKSVTLSLSFISFQRRNANKLIWIPMLLNSTWCTESKCNNYKRIVDRKKYKKKNNSTRTNKSFSRLFANTMHFELWINQCTHIIYISTVDRFYLPQRLKKIDGSFICVWESVFLYSFSFWSGFWLIWIHIMNAALFFYSLPNNIRDRQLKHEKKYLDFLPLEVWLCIFRHEKFNFTNITVCFFLFSS